MTRCHGPKDTVAEAIGLRLAHSILFLDLSMPSSPPAAVPDHHDDIDGLTVHDDESESQESRYWDGLGDSSFERLIDDGTIPCMWSAVIAQYYTLTFL